VKSERNLTWSSRGIAVIPESALSVSVSPKQRGDSRTYPDRYEL